MALVVSSVAALVGETPLIELRRTAQAEGLGCRLFAKLESRNGTGSVKDRVARRMLDEAQGEGLLRSDSVVVEPSSGSTGIALAALAAARGLRCVIVMPDTMSRERRQLLAAYGATLELTDGAGGMALALQRAQELCAQTPGAWMPDQFHNRANLRAHFTGTGPEIFEALHGRVDALIAGVGTGGTLCGAGAYLKSRRSTLRLVAVEPAASPVLSGGQRGRHAIEGIGAGFVPPLFQRELVDEICRVTDEEAFQASSQLARQEGLLVGPSAGAAFCAAMRLARRADSAGKTLVAIFPDGGERYLSRLA